MIIALCKKKITTLSKKKLEGKSWRGGAGTSSSKLAAAMRLKQAFFLLSKISSEPLVYLCHSTL